MQDARQGVSWRAKLKADKDDEQKVGFPMANYTAVIVVVLEISSDESAFPVTPCLMP